MKEQEFPKIGVRFVLPEEVEHYPISILELSERAKNALQRAGRHTIGDIINNWDSLKAGRLDNGSSDGLGAKSITEIHANVFAWLCDNGFVKKLTLNTEGL